MALTPEDVLNQKFTITKFRDGYDLDQVDDFLDTIVEELRQRVETETALRAEIDELTRKLQEAEANAGAADNPAEQTIIVDAPVAPEPVAPVEEAPAGAEPDAVKSSAMLQLALELHDKHIREGEAKRDQLVAEGEAARKDMLEDAEATSRGLIEDAQRQRADELKALAEQRSDLQFKIKDLRQFESEYRTTLRSYIQSQLRGLDGSPEPAGAPDGLQ